jgi:NAD(P)-dependent dehydrogenase (short-subunit alcohol dehydrogenase family)
MGRFDRKVALVTGAASGIGRATSERLSREGAHVAVCDIDESGGKTVAEACGGSFHRLDVSDPGAWRETVAEISDLRGGIDIACLNAGVTTHPPSADSEGFVPFELAELSDDAYRRILGVNVDGVVFGARATAPAIEARGGGAIVATASVAGLIGFAPAPIYTATKHAVVGLVRALAPLLAPGGIDVHAICPGIVDTNILGPGMGERAREHGVALMDPSEIADAIVAAIESKQTGGLWVCLAEREPALYTFAAIPGVEIPPAEE